MTYEKVLENKTINKTKDTEKINRNWKTCLKWKHKEKSRDVIKREWDRRKPTNSLTDA